MQIEDFYKLSNFHVNELDIKNRPIISKISRIKLKLMTRLDKAVIIAKESFGIEAGQFIIHCIMLGEHSKGSKHNTGEAVDGHFRGLNLYQSVMVGFKAGFHGIGYYIWWNSTGVHFDIRNQSHISTWASLEKGEYIYDYDTFCDRLLIEGT